MTIYSEENANFLKGKFSMNKYMLTAALVVCTPVMAGDNERAAPLAHPAELAIPWDIIGTYQSMAIDHSVKFIKPIKDCALSPVPDAKDDFLLQLHNCHQKRMGWLKI